jgi:ribosome recycling factor
MSAQEVRQSTDQKMSKSIESLRVTLSRIRTGRAHAGLLDHIQVDYYGSPVPISQVANVTLMDARTIGVSPWEKKMASVIEKAIRESDLGLNPVSMGDLLRVPLPPLSGMQTHIFGHGDCPFERAWSLARRSPIAQALEQSEAGRC